MTYNSQNHTELIPATLKLIVESNNTSNIMNTNQRNFLPLIIVAMVASLSSCSSDTTSPKEITSVSPAPTSSNSISSPSSTQNPSMAQLRAKSANIEPSLSPESQSENTPTANPQATTNKTINVTLYTSDTQCQALIPQKVTVGAEEPVTGAVGKILQERDTADFSLSGYRVNVKNGVATVDLRVSPQSKRQLASLSSCEQFAMFGSVRKTLTSNAQWNIKEVRFTEKGENVEL